MDTPQTLAADIIAAAVASRAVARAAVQASAKQIKDEAKANVRRSAPTHNARAHEAITYETSFTRTGVEAVIGYDKRLPGGGLGNLLEYGGGGDKSPAHRDLGGALDAELPRFEKEIAVLGAKLL